PLFSSSLIFLFHSSRDPPDLHSFPTRRSSDLLLHGDGYVEAVLDVVFLAYRVGEGLAILIERPAEHAGDEGSLRKSRLSRTALRSEEHTSELQSRENLVCRLLLEKKKKKKNNT